MGKCTTVSIYQVDCAGETGVQVGEGYLVHPCLVLVCPPLSDAIAVGCGPTRLRVGFCLNKDDGHRVEIIDGSKQPRVLGGSKSGGSPVVLELCSPAFSPINVVDGLSETQAEDEFVERTVRTRETNLAAQPDSVPNRNWWRVWLLKKLIP